MISAPVLSRRDRVVRLFLVQTGAITTPVAYSRAQLGHFLFGGGDASCEPWGAPAEAGIFDYLDGLTDGYFRITGAVDDWTHLPARASGDSFGAREIATVLRTVKDLRVDGRAPDALVFVYTGARAEYGAGGLGDVREAVRQGDQPALRDARWDAHDDLPFVRVSCCTRVAPPSDTRRWVSVAAITHTITHALTSVFAPSAAFARVAGADHTHQNRSKLRASARNGAARFEVAE